MNGLRPVVFLDRDGTLNVERGYIRQLNELELIPGAADAIVRLNKAGIAAVLVTNQTGAARGFYPESHIQDLNQRLVNLLAQGGAKLDAVYYCPHLATSQLEGYAVECNCRKPKTGLIDIALAEHSDFDRKYGYVVGDKQTDVELAVNIGMKGILVESGYGSTEIANSHNWKVQPACIATSISTAVDWILNDLGGASSKA